MSIRLMHSPNNYPFTHGWGLYPQLPTELGKRRRSAKYLLGCMDGTLKFKPREWQFALGVIETTFRSVAGESSRDWFTLANHLGQPSRALAHRIYEHLRRLKDLSRESADAGHILDDLDEMAFADMLQTFRGTTADENPHATDIREGWCHVLWSDQMPDGFLVGVVHGTPLEVVSILDRRLPGSRYGVLAAWHVADSNWAAHQVSRTFGRPLDELGLMHIPISEGVPQVKLLTENAIWKTIVPSPWHSDAPAAEYPDECGPEIEVGAGFTRIHANP